MPKRLKSKHKDFVSKRQLYRRVAEEVASIRRGSQNHVNDSFLNLSTPKVNLIGVNSDLLDTSTSQNHDDVLQNIKFSVSEDPIVCSPKLNHIVPVSHTNQSQASENDLLIRLRKWAVNEKVTHVATTKLLNILSDFHPNLPLDSRTLLCTPVQVKSRKVGSGRYVHMGLQNALQRFLRQNKWFTDSNIKVSFNIDGLPLYKSSNLQLWPILGLIKTTVTQPLEYIVVFQSPNH